MWLLAAFQKSVESVIGCYYDQRRGSPDISFDASE